MKKMSVPAIIGLFFFFCSWAFASSASPAKIEFILTALNGNVFFKTGAQVSPPACSAANEWAFYVVGANAASGKAMLATLLEAQAANKNIAVVGRGACDVWGDRESVDYIVVYSN